MKQEVKKWLELARYALVALAVVALYELTDIIAYVEPLGSCRKEVNSITKWELEALSQLQDKLDEENDTLSHITKNIVGHQNMVKPFNLHDTMNFIAPFECGENDRVCKDKNGNFKPYKDTNAMAIGFGNTSYMRKHGNDKNHRIDHKKAWSLLKADTETAKYQILVLTGIVQKHNLHGCELQALTSLVFNKGIGRFAGLKGRKPSRVFLELSKDAIDFKSLQNAWEGEPHLTRRKAEFNVFKECYKANH